MARRVRETTESSSTRIVTTSDYSDFGHQEVIVRPRATEAVEADEWTRIQQQRQEQDDGASSGEGSREPSCG